MLVIFCTIALIVWHFIFLYVLPTIRTFTNVSFSNGKYFITIKCAYVEYL